MSTGMPRPPKRAEFALSATAQLLNEILAADNAKPSSKNARCARLASRLGLHPKTIMQISNGGHCGRATAANIARLHSKTAPPKPPRLALTIDYTDDAQRQRHLTLTMEERRQALESWLAQLSKAKEKERYLSDTMLQEEHRSDRERDL